MLPLSQLLCLCLHLCLCLRLHLHCHRQLPLQKRWKPQRKGIQKKALQPLQRGRKMLQALPSPRSQLKDRCVINFMYCCYMHSLWNALFWVLIYYDYSTCTDHAMARLVVLLNARRLLNQRLVIYFTHLLRSLVCTDHAMSRLVVLLNARRLLNQRLVI